MSLVYYTNINGLKNELKPGVYKDGVWRLFIDSSKRSLKAVFLYNTHSTKLNENYNNMKIVLEKIK